MRILLLLMLTLFLSRVWGQTVPTSLPARPPHAPAGSPIAAETLTELGLVAMLAKAKAESESAVLRLALLNPPTDPATQAHLLPLLQAYSQQKVLTDALLLQLTADNYQAGLLRRMPYKRLNKLARAATTEVITNTYTYPKSLTLYATGLTAILAAATQVRQLAIQETQRRLAGQASADHSKTESFSLTGSIDALGTTIGIMKDLADMKAARAASINGVLDNLRLAPLSDIVKMP